MERTRLRVTACAAGPPPPFRPPAQAAPLRRVADLGVFRRHRTRLVNFRILTFLAVSVFCCSNATRAEEKTWSDNKITPEQPFPAKVCAVAPSWGGYHLLLEELGGTHRRCIARLWMTAPLEYIVLDAAKGETAEWPQRTEGWTYITPGIEVDRFSWSVGAWKLGRIFGNDDVLRMVPRIKDRTE